MVSALTIRTFEISGYSREDTSLFFISNWRLHYCTCFLCLVTIGNSYYVTTIIISICQNNNDRIQVYKVPREVAKMGENLTILCEAIKCNL